MVVRLAKRPSVGVVLLNVPPTLWSNAFEFESLVECVQTIAVNWISHARISTAQCVDIAGLVYSIHSMVFSRVE